MTTTPPLSPLAAGLLARLGPHPGPELDADTVWALAGLGPGRIRGVLDDLVDADLTEPVSSGRYRLTPREHHTATALPHTPAGRAEHIDALLLAADLAAPENAEAGRCAALALAAAARAGDLDAQTRAHTRLAEHAAATGRTALARSHALIAVQVHARAGRHPPAMCAAPWPP